MPLILASTSVYRQKLLARLGRPFEIFNPDVDESQHKPLITNPWKLAEHLALVKAQAVAKLVADKPVSLIIGSDQVIIFQDKILDKPLTQERAIEQLKTMASKEHILYTAVALVSGSRQEVFGVSAKMMMRPLTDAEIIDYVQQDQPLDCAGSYKLESGGIRLFSKIETTDFSTIEGLPLLELESRIRAWTQKN